MPVSNVQRRADRLPQGGLCGSRCWGLHVLHELVSGRLERRPVEGEPKSHGYWHPDRAQPPARENKNGQQPQAVQSAIENVQG